jgi:phage baseplate assembly protein W
MAVSDDIIGTGVRFPLKPDARGRLGYVTGADNIEQSLKLVLLTNVRERVMRSNFGSTLREMVFAPGSEQSLRLLETTVVEAVRDWEPRVDILSITAEADPRTPSHVIIDLNYLIRATYVRGNLVFPFYIGGAAEAIA